MTSGNKSLYTKLAFLLISLLILGYFSFTSSGPDDENTDVVSDKEKTDTVVGILRTTGLESEEKEKLGLKYAKYEVVNLVSTDLSVPTSNPNRSGVFIESKNVKSDLVGTCVTLKGSVDQDWSNLKDTTMNGSYTYGNLSFEPDDIDEEDFSECERSYSKLDHSQYADMQKIEFVGVVEHMTRPAPDIAYDYKIKLEKPYKDPFTSKGEEMEVSEYIVVPQDYETWKRLEEKLGKKVVLEGYTVWGLAETRHFETVSVK